ncbi:subtilisin-like serine protease [Methanomethylovorans hollandica DSM 15978]|uniref:Subtilisin-like serine protease n=2 Tax=Methanomethylovorans hollandica TaxID=101192 RepID=L0KUW0_METHD|nr:subtilisin-like serine protease [Methanomethylovorans hollandica DSM 15978]
MVTYIETTEKKTSATSNTTELNKNIVMSNFVYVLYDISDENLEIYTSEKSSLMLKTGTIQTTTPPKLLLNSMNNDGHFPVEGSVKSPEEYEYYLVQFNGTSKKTWKQDIPEIGAQLLDYVPDNAFVVRMNGSTATMVSNLEHVRWMGDYLPEYKIDPSLRTKTEENISVELMISLFEPIDKSNIKEEVTEEIISLGGKILDGSNNDRIHIEIPNSKISALSNIKDVKWIEGYEQIAIFNDVALGIIDAAYVSENYNLTGHGQIIAVADTGLDTGINNASINPDFYGRILAIQDITGDGAEDLQGHGTHVTGSALGNGSWSNGKYKGVAPEAQLVFQAIANADGSLMIPGNNVNALFKPAYELGARIHSNSWGGTGDGTYTIYSKDVDKFMWTHPDMLIVFAAGNSGVDSDADGMIDPDCIAWPATAKNCLSVGASENNRAHTIGMTWGSITDGFDVPIYPAAPINSDYIADNPKGIAAFSSRGPTDDGRIKPDVVAPGTYIISARSNASDNKDVWGFVDEHYVYMGGTSMATPIVAGSVALIRQNYVDKLNISPSAALLKATVINGASDLKPGQYGNDVTGQPDHNQGWGLVNLKESLYPDSGYIYFADNIKLQTGDAVDKNYYVNNSSRSFKTTLAWTDYYSTEIAQKVLVNDLTLLVVKPDGTEVVVNDTVNNVEQVFFEETDAGWYTVKVVGEDVQKGPQPCAIVVSGASAALSYLDLNPQQTTYYTGNTTTFEAEARDENNNQLQAVLMWESSDPTVASINSSTGHFIALAEGITNITANAGTMYSTVSINVLDSGNPKRTNESSEVVPNEEEKEQKTTPTSSSRSGGGGGGGNSGENQANVLVKEPETLVVIKDSNIRYEFTEDGNSIGHIEFTALKNSGKITAFVEALNDRSSFAKSNAPGKVYQNVNIWVGKAGFATESNIDDPVIGFKVARTWMASNGVDKTSIRLYRYSSDVWNELPAKITNEDEQYVYYESETPGFSPFAISTAETTTEFLTQISGTENDTSNDRTKLSGKINESNSNDSERDSLEDEDKSSGDKIGHLSKFTIASIALFTSGMVYRYYKKRK